MEPPSQRNPIKEITLKISFGIIITLTLVGIYTLITRENISLEILGMFLFFLGGIFFVIGGTRDFFESVIIKRLRGKQSNSDLKPDTKGLFGFGEPGEDILAGVVLIFLALICWMIVI